MNGSPDDNRLAALFDRQMELVNCELNKQRIKLFTRIQPDQKVLKMSNVDEKIKNALTEFSEELGNKKFFDLEPEEIQAKKIKKQDKDNEQWGEWCKSSGVYCFCNETNIFYIGRALSSFGGRMCAHIRGGDTEWQKDIGTATIKLIHIEKKYITAALEIYLIEKLAPKHNERCG